MRQSKYIGTTEAVQMTGLSIKEILGLLHDGTIHFHRTRRGHYRFLPEELEKLGLVKPKEEEPFLEEEIEEDDPLVEEELGEDGFSYIQDEEHYTEVFKRMTEVRHSLKISTGDLKNFNVIVESDGGEETLRLCDFFLSLVERGVKVQVVSMDPFGFYLYTKENCPQLLEHPLFDLRYKKRCHMKIFIFDDECAYFGSANITGAAIGRRASGRRNNEAGMLVCGSMMQAPLRHFEKVWNDPDILKHTWKRFATMAKELEKDLKERYGK